MAEIKLLNGALTSKEKQLKLYKEKEDQEVKLGFENLGFIDPKLVFAA